MVFRQILAATSVLTLALTIGCKSGTQPSLDGSVGATQSSAPYPFNDPKYQELVKEVQGENAKSSGMFETESAGSKLTAKLKQATAAVGDALAIKPEVTPAYDPVSLGTDVCVEPGGILPSASPRQDVLAGLVYGAVSRRSDRVHRP